MAAKLKEIPVKPSLEEWYDDCLCKDYRDSLEAIKIRLTDTFAIDNNVTTIYAGAPVNFAELQIQCNRCRGTGKQLTARGKALFDLLKPLLLEEMKTQEPKKEGA